MLKPDSRSKAGPAQDSGFSLRVIPTAPLIMGAQASFLWTGVCSSFIFPTGVAGVTPASVLPSRVATRMAPLNWLELEVHEPEGPPPPFLPCSHFWHLPSWLVVCTSTEEKLEAPPLGQMAWVPTKAPPQTSPLTSGLSASLAAVTISSDFQSPRK